MDCLEVILTVSVLLMETVVDRPVPLMEEDHQMEDLPITVPHRVGYLVHPEELVHQGGVAHPSHLIGRHLPHQEEDHRTVDLMMMMIPRSQKTSMM